MKTMIIASGAVISAAIGFLVGKYAIIECQLAKKHKEKEKNVK